MSQHLRMEPEQVLREIEADAKQRFLPILGPVKGKVLVDLVREYKPKRVLEIGTLVGYSAILMSMYLPKGSKITTIEIDSKIAKIAQSNFKEVGIAKMIDLRVGNALDLIPKLKGPFDLLFLDAAKEEYFDYLKLAEEKLAKNAVIAADNAGMFADAMADFLNYVRNSGKYKSKTYDFGFDAVEVSVKDF